MESRGVNRPVFVGQKPAHTPPPDSGRFGSKTRIGIPRIGPALQMTADIVVHHLVEMRCRSLARAFSTPPYEDILIFEVVTCFVQTLFILFFVRGSRVEHGNFSRTRQMSYPHYPRPPLNVYPPNVTAMTSTLPPNPPLTVIPAGTNVLAFYQDFAWYFGVVQNYSVSRNGSVMYEVLFRSGEVRTVGTNQVLNSQSNNHYIDVGSRVVVQHPTKSMLISSLVAELPSVENMFRYLLFLDDGAACYKTKDKLWVINLIENPVMMLPLPYKTFIQEYFAMNGTSIKLLNLAPNDSVVFVNYDGSTYQYTGKVVEVDCNVVLVRYSLATGSLAEEWIHRGSNRIISYGHNPNPFNAVHDQKGNGMSKMAGLNLPMSLGEGIAGRGVLDDVTSVIKSPLKGKPYMVPPNFDPFMFSEEGDAVSKAAKYSSFNSWPVHNNVPTSTIYSEQQQPAAPYKPEPYKPQPIPVPQSPILIPDESPVKSVPAFDSPSSNQFYPDPISSSQSSTKSFQENIEDSPNVSCSPSSFKPTSSVFAWNEESTSRRRLNFSPKINTDLDVEFDFADSILNTPVSSSVSSLPSPVIKEEIKPEVITIEPSPTKRPPTPPPPLMTAPPEVVMIDDDEEEEELQEEEDEEEDEVLPLLPPPPALEMKVDPVMIDVKPPLPMILHQEACDPLLSAVECTSTQNGNVIEVHVTSGDNGECISLDPSSIEIVTAPAETEDETRPFSPVVIISSPVSSNGSKSRKRRLVTSPAKSIPKMRINLRALNDHQTSKAAAQKCVKRARKQQSKESKDAKQSIAEKRRKIAKNSLTEQNIRSLWKKKESIKINSEARISKWCAPWSRLMKGASYQPLRGRLLTTNGTSSGPDPVGLLMEKIGEGELEEGELEEGEIGEEEIESEVEEVEAPKPHTCSILCNVYEKGGSSTSTRIPLVLPCDNGWRRDIIRGCIVYTAPCGIKCTTLGQISTQLSLSKCTNLSIHNFSFHLAVTLETDPAKLPFEPLFSDNDLSNGLEHVPVPFVSNIGPIIKYNFRYMVDPQLQTKQHNRAEDLPVTCMCETCEGDGCTCISTTLIRRECNGGCGCSITCSNRCVQRGLRHQLTIFQEDTSYRVVTVQDIPPEAFICCIAGVVKSVPVDEGEEEFVYSLDPAHYNVPLEEAPEMEKEVGESEVAAAKVTRSFLQDDSKISLSSSLELAGRAFDGELSRNPSYLSRQWLRTAITLRHQRSLTDTTLQSSYPSLFTKKRPVTATPSSTEAQAPETVRKLVLDCSENGNVGRVIPISDKRGNAKIVPVIVDNPAVPWLAVVSTDLIWQSDLFTPVPCERTHRFNYREITIKNSIAEHPVRRLAMPIFGRPGPFDEAVTKICDVGTENDDWQLIMNLCDSVNTTKDGPKNIMRAIMKRIKSANPIQLEHAVTLLDACVNNCNKPFHLELCTRATVTELKEYLTKNKAPSKGINSLKENMVKWSKGFGEDTQLYLRQVTILQLKSEGEACDPLLSAVECTSTQNGNVIEVHVTSGDNGECISLDPSSIEIVTAPAETEDETRPFSPVVIISSPVSSNGSKSRKRRLVTSPAKSIPKMRINLRALNDHQTSKAAAQKCVKRARKQQSKESKDAKQSIAEKRRKIAKNSLTEQNIRSLWKKKESIKINSEARISKWCAPWSRLMKGASYQPLRGRLLTTNGTSSGPDPVGLLMEKIGDEELEEGELEEGEIGEEEIESEVEEVEAPKPHTCSILCNVYEKGGSSTSTRIPLVLPCDNGWRRDIIRGCIVYTAPCGIKCTTLGQISTQLSLSKCTNLSIHNFSFHLAVTLETDPAKLPFEPLFSDNDLSNGLEHVPVPFVSNIGPIIKYNFRYMVDPQLQTKQHNRAEDLPVTCMCETCEGDGCTCISTTLIRRECNGGCGCSITCSNRCVQRGLRHQLTIFQEDTSYRVVTVQDIPPEAFICCIAGVVKSVPVDEGEEEFVYSLDPAHYNVPVEEAPEVEKETEESEVAAAKVTRSFLQDDSKISLSSSLELAGRAFDGELSRNPSYLSRQWLRTAITLRHQRSLTDTTLQSSYPSLFTKKRPVTATPSSTEAQAPETVRKLVLDCSENGNVGRFIPISDKRGNAKIVPVIVDNPAVPWLAVVSTDLIWQSDLFTPVPCERTHRFYYQERTIKHSIAEHPARRLAMPIFGRPGPFDEAVTKICDVGTENDDWQLIMNLCDSVNTTKDGPKNIMRAIMKRIKSANPIQLEHAVTLLDACVNNCNKPFHLELCTRATVTELKEYLTKNKAPSKGINSLKENMVKWSKGFGEDTQLYLLQVTILQLKSEGVTFPNEIGVTPPINLPAPPSASARRQESEDEMLRKAIEASLKQTSGSGAAGSSSGNTGGGGGGGIYPTFTADKPLSTDRELFKVRALYDFEAAEENEITFKSGDMISVTDNADQNWWKGRTPSSSGLFPANFVTRDLAVTPPPDPSTAAPAPAVAKVTEVNPGQIDLLLEMLRKADATVTNAEEDRFVEELETSMTVQEGLVQAEYDRLKGKHDELDSINDDMSRVVGLFHKLLKEAPAMAPAPAPQPIQYSYQPPTAAPMKASEPARQFQQQPPATMAQPQPPQFIPYHDPYSMAPHPGMPQQHSPAPQQQGGPYQPPPHSPPPSYSGREAPSSVGGSYRPPPPQQAYYPPPPPSQGGVPYSHHMPYPGGPPPPQQHEETSSSSFDVLQKRLEGYIVSRALLACIELTGWWSGGEQQPQQTDEERAEEVRQRRLQQFGAVSVEQGPGGRTPTIDTTGAPAAGTTDTTPTAPTDPPISPEKSTTDDNQDDNNDVIDDDDITPTMEEGRVVGGSAVGCLQEIISSEETEEEDLVTMMYPILNHVITLSRDCSLSTAPRTLALLNTLNTLSANRGASTDYLPARAGVMYYIYNNSAVSVEQGPGGRAPTNDTTCAPAAGTTDTTPTATTDPPISPEKSTTDDNQDDNNDVIDDDDITPTMEEGRVVGGSAVVREITPDSDNPWASEWGEEGSSSNVQVVTQKTVQVIFERLSLSDEEITACSYECGGGRNIPTERLIIPYLLGCVARASRERADPHIQVVLESCRKTAVRMIGEAALCSNRLAAAKLGEKLIGVFVDVEQSSEFEHKFQYRYHIFELLDYIWPRPEFGLSTLSEEVKGREEDTTVLFTKFLQLLMNDANFLLDESFRQLEEIRKLEQLQDTEEWGLLDDTARSSKLRSLAQMKRACTYYNMMIKNLQDVKFHPDKLLIGISEIYINLREQPAFIAAIPRDGRSYHSALFTNAIAKLRKLQYSEEKIEMFLEVSVLAAEAVTSEEVEGILTERAPEHYLDPILGTLMTEPVLLPTSRVIVERSVIAKHLLSDPIDPFNRQPLSMKDVQPDTELRDEIAAWRRTELSPDPVSKVAIRSCRRRQTEKGIGVK
eukprot:sb/3460338/